MAKKNKTLNYLGIGAALVVIWYWYKNKSIQGIGARPKYKYTFLTVLWGRDENNLKNNLIEKKFFTTTAVNQSTARDRVRKKFPLPYEIELYSTELVEKKNSIVNNIDKIKATKKVAAMTNEQVVKEISKIFHYEMQDNEVDESEIWNNIPEARKQLIKHYQEIF